MHEPCASEAFRVIALKYLDYLGSLRAGREITQNKLDWHTSTVLNYLVPFFRERSISEIVSADIEAFMDARRRGKLSTNPRVAERTKDVELRHKLARIGNYAALAPLIDRDDALRPAPSTLNNQTAVLRALFSFAQRRGFLKQAPEIPYSPLRDRFSTRPAFSQVEVMDLINLAGREENWVEGMHPNAQYYRRALHVFVTLAYLTGLRTSEELVLRWSDVRPRPSGGVYITVRAQIEGAFKTGFRTVIASESVRNLIGEYLAEKRPASLEDFIFMHPPESRHAGDRIRSFKKSWHSLMKRFGQEYDDAGRRRTLYSLRHTHISIMLQRRQMSLYQLSENVGTSPEMIWKYYGKGAAFDEIDALGLISL